jgi:hypothetical protein
MWAVNPVRVLGHTSTHIRALYAVRTFTAIVDGLFELALPKRCAQLTGEPLYVLCHVCLCAAVSVCVYWVYQNVCWLQFLDIVTPLYNILRMNNILT